MDVWISNCDLWFGWFGIKIELVLAPACLLPTYSSHSDGAKTFTANHPFSLEDIRLYKECLNF